MKLCKDCKHHNMYKCTKTWTEPCTGKSTGPGFGCDKARGYQWACGAQASGFEPKSGRGLFEQCHDCVNKACGDCVDGSNKATTTKLDGQPVVPCPNCVHCTKDNYECKSCREYDHFEAKLTPAKFVDMFGDYKSYTSMTCGQCENLLNCSKWPSGVCVRGSAFKAKQEEHKSYEIASSVAGIDQFKMLTKAKHCKLCGRHPLATTPGSVSCASDSDKCYLAGVSMPLVFWNTLNG